MSETRGETTGTRAAVTAVGGVLAAVALLLVMLTWAATIGPDEVVAGGREPSYAQPSPTAVENVDSGVEDPDGEWQRHELLWLVLTITAVALAAVVALAGFLTVLRWLLTRDWRRHREPDPEEVAFQTLGAPALARTLAEGAPAQRRLLDDGTPRNAIVACWHQFEQHAAAAGLHRASWETSSEFTLRVLDDLSADPAAVIALADLYRDARHSHHEITEESRTRARAALDRILETVQVPSAGVT